VEKSPATISDPYDTPLDPLDRAGFGEVNDCPGKSVGKPGLAPAGKSFRKVGFGELQALAYRVAQSRGLVCLTIGDDA
jgi:hypothetical protein